MRRGNRVGELPALVQRLALVWLGVLNVEGAGLPVLTGDRHLHLGGTGTTENAAGQVGLPIAQIVLVHSQRVDLLRLRAGLLGILPLLSLRGPVAPCGAVHADQLLMILFLVAHGVETAAGHRITRTGEGQGVHARLRCVLGVRVRHTVVRKPAGVPVARHGTSHNLLDRQRLDALGSPLRALVTGAQVLQRVGVATDGDRIGVTVQDLVQGLRVVGDDFLVVHDRRVSVDDDVLVLRDVREVVLQPLELPLADLLVVAAVAAARLLALVFNVVEGDEVRVADLVGVVGGTELGTVGVGGVLIGVDVVVLVVVARERADRTVGALVQAAQVGVEAEVVADVVTEQHDAAAVVVIALGQVGGRTLAGVLDLFLVIGLGVRGDDAVLVVLGGGLGLCHREVHVLRDGAGRLQPAELQVLRGAFRLVNVAELGEVIRVDGHLPAGGLGDGDVHVLVHRQGVAAVGVGGGHVAAVGDLDSLDALFALVVGGVLVRIVEDVPGDGGLVFGVLFCGFDGALVEAGPAWGAVAGAREAGAQVAGAQVAGPDQAWGCIGGTNSGGQGRYCSHCEQRRPEGLLFLHCQRTPLELIT